MDKLDHPYDQAAEHAEAVRFTPEEIAGIEAALAQARAGMVVDFEDVVAWVKSLGTATHLAEPLAPGEP